METVDSVRMRLIGRHSHALSVTSGCCIQRRHWRSAPAVQRRQHHRRLWTVAAPVLECCRRTSGDRVILPPYQRWYNVSALPAVVWYYHRTSGVAAIHVCTARERRQRRWQAVLAVQRREAMVFRGFTPGD
jgi:hypothetical protein